MKQAEIWWIDLGPVKGAEMDKTRPVVIVGNDLIGRLPLKIIVPLTDWKERYDLAPWMIKVAPSAQNGLQKRSAADCFQVRSVSVERFVDRLGAIDPHLMSLIQKALAKVFSIR